MAKFGLIWPIGRPDVAGNQIEELFGPRREPADAEIAADDHDGDVHAAEEIGEVAVDTGQLVVARVQLVVHRVQFFVRALQLFFRGVQLLVRALKLLVARQDFLVR